MAIGTNDTIVKFGTQDDLDNTSVAVANDAFSLSTDLAQWTNDDDAPMASVVGLFNFSTNPTAGSAINLYARPMNIVDTTKDQNAPTADQPVTFLGAFILDNVTTEQVLAIEVSLPNVKTSQVYEFYIENKSGQSLPALWSLQITPKTFGPSA